MHTLLVVSILLSVLWSHLLSHCKTIFFFSNVKTKSISRPRKSKNKIIKYKLMSNERNTHIQGVFYSLYDTGVSRCCDLTFLAFPTNFLYNDKRGLILILLYRSSCKRAKKSFYIPLYTYINREFGS